MKTVKRHVLDMRSDARGWVTNPIVASPSDAPLGHVHIGSMAPGAVRGNHVHPDAADLAAALHDGEDYELLFTLPPGDAAALTRGGSLAVAVTRIGTITEEAAMTLVHPDARREPLTPAGWEHST